MLKYPLVGLLWLWVMTSAMEQVTCGDNCQIHYDPASTRTCRVVAYDPEPYLYDRAIQTWVDHGCKVITFSKWKDLMSYQLFIAMESGNHTKFINTLNSHTKLCNMIPSPFEYVRGLAC